MNVKFINVFLLLNFSSCGGCKEITEQRIPRRHYNPNHANNITFINISDEEAKDLKFWENYNIDENIRIFPIEEEIKSNTWEENGNILIAITAFLSVAKNVEMLNDYKNFNPLNKLLLFIAHTINNGRNISKYEYLFCQEFKRLLKEIYPDEYEILLKNPIALEMKLQLLVINGINKKNPESRGKLCVYTSCAEEDKIKNRIRLFMFIPDSEDIIDSKDNWLWILTALDNQTEEKKFQKLLIDERQQYLQTQRKPDLSSLKNEIIKIMQNNIQLIESSEVKSDLLTNVSTSQIHNVEILENLICTGHFYGWFMNFFDAFSSNTSSKKIENSFIIPKDKKKRFFVLANYNTGRKYFGDIKLYNIGSLFPCVELYINLDKQSFSIQAGKSALLQS